MAPRKRRQRRPAADGGGRPAASPSSQSASRSGPLKAPETDYTSSEGAVLTLRGSLSVGTRNEYARVVQGSPLSREDAWHRAVEFLFERLAVRWAIAGAPAIDRQRELLARLRMATPDERAWVRETLRVHCAENFPDVQAP